MTRKLSLQNLAGERSRLLIEEKLRDAGMSHINVNLGQSSVTVTYDVLAKNLNAIENLLDDIGYPLSTRRWFRLKLGLWKILDENTRGRLNSVHQCCNKSPR